MNDAVFGSIEKSCRILRLDFFSAEFAALADEFAFSEDAVTAVERVLEHLQEKKKQATIRTLLRLSRLPLKDPKTFDTFDFSVIRGNYKPYLPSMLTKIWHSSVLPVPKKHIWLKLWVMNIAITA